MNHILKFRRYRLALGAMAVSLLGASVVGAESLDFSNPAVVMSGDAVIASGTCIAKYVAILNDESQPAESVGKNVAKHCNREITRSAGLAAWLAGNPDDFSKNLKYAQEELTTNAVLRFRLAAQNVRLAQDR